jgi:hypothetical protein
MEIIIYAHKENDQKDKLQKKISQVSNTTPAIAFDFEDLFNLMRSKISGYVIIVFLISSAKELEFLDSNRKYLTNTRYIIILPNGEDTLVFSALSLYPRYLAHTHHNFNDVSAVLGKMIQNYTREEKQIIRAHKKNLIAH